MSYLSAKSITKTCKLSLSRVRFSLKIMKQKLMDFFFTNTDFVSNWYHDCKFVPQDVMLDLEVVTVLCRPYDSHEKRMYENLSLCARWLKIVNIVYRYNFHEHMGRIYGA